jgi:hypothetical protein
MNGWLSVILGTISVATGALVVSGGLALIGECKSFWELMKKCLRAKVIVLLLLVGSALVGLGGTLTTLGWNKLDNASQKRALIVGLAREWMLNELDTLGPPMSFDPNDPKLGKEHFMYPQFRTSAQDSILTSALFYMTNRKDNELLLAVTHYAHIIRSFNTQLAWVNEKCVNLPEDVKQQKRKEMYLLIRDKAPLHIHFKRFHEELKNLLHKEYGWALDEVRPMLDKIRHLQENKIIGVG